FMSTLAACPGGCAVLHAAVVLSPPAIPAGRFNRSMSEMWLLSSLLASCPTHPAASMSLHQEITPHSDRSSTTASRQQGLTHRSFGSTISSCLTAAYANGLNSLCGAHSREPGMLHPTVPWQRASTADRWQTPYAILGSGSVELPSIRVLILPF